MPAPRVFVLRAPGTNCNEETAYAFEKAGAVTEQVHVKRWLEEPSIAKDFQILCFPGGFSYGDDIAAGRILGNQLQHHLREELTAFKDDGKLILGICNGFQVLLKTGILLADDEQSQSPATLGWNDSQKFEDRWTHLKCAGHCVFTQGAESMYLPVAHAEGKFIARSKEALDKLEAAGMLTLRYTSDGKSESKDNPLGYPENPNGSQADVAGVCDSTGRVLGLMPHPERYIDRTHHPRWTRGEGSDPGDGLRIFQNAVNYFS